METNVKRRLVVQLAGIVLVSIPTVAYAHGGNNDANVVHACIGNISRIVRIVGVSGACVASPPLIAETPAHWDIQGPAGINGTNGTNGVSGTNGTNGTDGTNGKDGKDGTNGIDGTSVTFVDYFSGNQHGCPNGGAIFAAGGVNAYVCNGVDGKDGKDGKDGVGAARADGPCFDSVNRYVNCMNGTAADTVTGLIWLEQADCLSNNSWRAANEIVAGLKDGECGLTDHSAPGDWRLPTKAEWEAMIARAVALGCISDGLGGPPSLTKNSGTVCYGTGAFSSFPGVASDLYWSSSSNVVSPTGAWFADLDRGSVSGFDKDTILRVWPVRSGSR
jgi:hypothetical protein